MELQPPSVQDVVNDDTPIWRYMDLPKFVSMLATGTLRFTKAATFRDDPYEGFCKAVSLEVPPPFDGRAGLTGRQKVSLSVERGRAGISQSSAQVCRNARDYLYLNSWCLAAESMAMWEIYGSHGHGLALKSSVDLYQRAAKFEVSTEHYDFRQVKYHADIESSPDVERDFRVGAVPAPGPGLWPEVLRLAFHKRDCYEYEKEWRAALYQDYRPDVDGIDVDFNLEQLISAVYIGPRAEPFFFDAVASVMDKFCFQKPLESSALLRAPRKEAVVSYLHRAP